MVHGGFYYQVDKKRLIPGEIPEILHWFKWEATLTWITGFLLLVVLYFLRGASLLIDPRVRELGQFQAVALTLVMLVGSWLIYDLIWNSKVVRSPRMSIALSAVFFSGLVYFSTQIFSGRGSFILVGAILGSLMLLNVWVRILPGQSKMLKEALAGQVPDYSASAKSKVRSVHNTYFIFPVLFIMLSNHYPAVYNHEKSWLLLILLAVSGALLRHAMVAKNPIERWTLMPAAIGLVALVFMTATERKIAQMNGVVEYPQVAAIVHSRCLNCHSTANRDDIFKVAPKGVVFETEGQLLQYKEKILLQVVANRTMPLLNKTGMTEDERMIMNRFFTQ